MVESAGRDACSSPRRSPTALDGYLARQLGITTPLGEFLDPVADKLMVATALVLLVGHDTRAFIVITAIVIIGREITVSALREWMAQLGRARPRSPSPGWASSRRSCR